MSLLPSSPDVSPDGDPRVVDLDSEEADELMAALSSSTARRILAALHDDPAPPGELADRVDTSLQNAQYHLEKLDDAGAIEVVGTAYSEKGREMSVYGPADSPLVIFAGEAERASGLRSALSRLFAGFLALGVGGAVIQTLFGGDDGVPPTESGGDAAPASTPNPEETPAPAATPNPEATPTPTPGDGDDAGAFDAPADTPEPEPTPAPEPTPEAMEEPVPEPTATPVPELEDAAAEGSDGFLTALEGLLVGGMPPGLAFFLGGAAVLTLVVGVTYLRTRRYA
jgi:DNA-binding transcriptional ArsR family regulator